MTEVNALKARIVELERQSVKALDGLMKANDRLLTSTKLQRWGDEKPDVGRPFVLYRRKKWGGTWCRRDFVQGQASTFTFTTEDTGVACVWPPTQPSDRWCYVPSAPDWDEIES